MPTSMSRAFIAMTRLTQYSSPSSCSVWIALADQTHRIGCDQQEIVNLVMSHGTRSLESTLCLSIRSQWRQI